MGLIFPQALRAESLAECQARVGECEELLDFANRAIQRQGELIYQQSEQLHDLRFNYKIVKNRLEEVESEAGAWYRNPVIVVPLSFVLGAVVYSQATK